MVGCPLGYKYGFTASSTEVGFPEPRLLGITQIFLLQFVEKVPSRGVPVLHSATVSNPLPSASLHLSFSLHHFHFHSSSLQQQSSHGRIGYGGWHKTGLPSVPFQGLY